MITKKEKEDFIEDILEVCRKHNLTLSHEDAHGAFVVEELDGMHIKWIRYAIEYESPY